jgi:monothiol glutaredoxin
MELSSAQRARIETLIASDHVVLFMKGDRRQPRCGFSATVVQILDGVLDQYATYDVLADAELRDGIKVFSDWPTIPQLYIGKEFVGGADIVKEMAQSGELHSKLGVANTPMGAITVTVTDAAKQALAAAREQQPAHERFLRLSVNGQYQHGLSFGPEMSGDVKAEANGMSLRMDGASAKRANGLVIDFVTTPQSGFRLDNPNQPAVVKQISVVDLKARLDAAATAGTKLALFDVRTPSERERATIGGTLLDDAARESLLAMDKQTPLYFHCHHGGRSQAAAEFYLKQGFRTVYNVTGGIEAWSLQVDAKVARY